MFIYLIHLIPCGVKISLDSLTCECFPPNVDLDIGVALPFNHAPHHIIFRNEVLACQQVDSKQSLKKKKKTNKFDKTKYNLKCKSFLRSSITSVAKLG